MFEGGQKKGGEERNLMGVCGWVGKGFDGCLWVGGKGV